MYLSFPYCFSLFEDSPLLYAVDSFNLSSPKLDLRIYALNHDPFSFFGCGDLGNSHKLPGSAHISYYCCFYYYSIGFDIAGFDKILQFTTLACAFATNAFS